MRTVSNFREWAYKKAREFDQFKKNHNYIYLTFYKRSTILINLKNGKTWIAACHESDSFDVNIGKGIAFARFLGEEIPVEQKKVKLSNLKYGDRFTTCDNRYTYIFVAQEPVLQQYIYVNEQTTQICIVSFDMSVYTA